MKGKRKLLTWNIQSFNNFNLTASTLYTLWFICLLFLHFISEKWVIFPQRTFDV